MDKFKNNDNERLEAARIMFVHEIKKLAEIASVRDLKLFRMAVEILACLIDENREMNKGYLLPELGEANTKNLVVLCMSLKKSLLI